MGTSGAENVNSLWG